MLNTNLALLELTAIGRYQDWCGQHAAGGAAEICVASSLMSLLLAGGKQAPHALFCMLMQQCAGQLTASLFYLKGILERCCCIT